MNKISETQKLFLKKMGGPKERGGGFKRGLVLNRKRKGGDKLQKKRNLWGLFGFVSGRKEERSWVGLGWVGV